MQIAILTVSSLALAVGVANLAIIAKTAHELKTAKAEVDDAVTEVKAKVEHNAKVVKAALGALEF